MVKPLSQPVVVVGGGVAGLVCAWALARAGVPVRLVEAAPTLGGRCGQSGKTVLEWQGAEQDFPLAHGVHGIWRGYTHLNGVIEALGTARNLVSVAQQGFVFRRPDGSAGCLEIGHSVRNSPLPTALAPLSMLRSREFFRNPSLFMKSGDLLPSPLQRMLAFDPNDLAGLDPVSARAFVKGWPPLLERLMTTLCRSAFFAEPQDVSLGAFLTGLWTYGIAHKASSHFWLFENGIHQDLVTPLGNAIVEAGGEVMTGWRCTGVALGQNGVRGINLVHGDGRRKQWKTAAVVLAVDAPALQRLARGALAERLGQYAVPQGAGSAVVRLWYEGTPNETRPWAGLLAHGCADTYFWLHRFYGPAVDWHRRTGGACLELHGYGANAARLASLSSAAAIREVDGTVGWAWPEIGKRIHGHVQINPATHPHFAPHHFKNLPPVDMGIPGLSLCGDWIQCPQPSLFLERSTLTALLAARAATERLGMPLDALPAIHATPEPSTSLRVLGRLARLARRTAR